MIKPNRYLNSLIDRYLKEIILESTRVLFIDSQFTLYPILEKSRELIFIKTDSYDQLKNSNLDHVDYIVIDGSFHYSSNIQDLLDDLKTISNKNTRIIIITYNFLWIPLFKLGTLFRLRKKTKEMNWLSQIDLNNFYNLSGLELVTISKKILCPFQFLFIGDLVNRFILPLPIIENLSMLQFNIVKTLNEKLLSNENEKAVSIVVPARNESGNIDRIVTEIPFFTDKDEIIFIEGGSKDNTWEKILGVQKQYADKKRIIAIRQTGTGKGNAVREGFALAQNNIFMIYDADMTVPAKDLIKFHTALVHEKGELINGSRLVYPMENNAMKFFNILGNKFFAKSFSFVLGQQLKDTLCGTKVLTRKNYEKIQQSRSFFGAEDPFGDFDLLLGASKNCLKIIELPVAYRDRTYGTTNISRWKHGWILLKMLIKASLKIKFI